MRIAKITSCLLFCASFLAMAEDKVVAVNDYVGLNYKGEPVSFEFSPKAATPLAKIGIKEAAPYQVELLEGTAEAATKVRVWIQIDMPFVEYKDKRGNTRYKPGTGAQRHQLFTITTEGAAAPAEKKTKVSDGGTFGPVKLAIVDNGLIRAKIPTSSHEFERPVLAYSIPGPVNSIATGQDDFIGTGYLSSFIRIKSITTTVDHGPVYFESKITYAFDNGKHYTVSARVYNYHRFVSLVEDFNVGGNARFIYSYDDWTTDSVLYPGDNEPLRWLPFNHKWVGDNYLQVDGMKAMGRMVIWSQYNYFNGKQETIGLKSPDQDAIAAKVENDFKRALAQWEKNQAKWKKKPPKNGIPPKPTMPEIPKVEEVDYTLFGASMKIATPITPEGNGTAIGGFFMRPDRWTRVKINHVDMILSPEVPGDRLTRGTVGLKGAVLRPAMEAWIIDGHREWGLYATPAKNRTWLVRAHIVHGAYPLDRLNKVPVVWNPDGSPVPPEQSAPSDRSGGFWLGSIFGGGLSGRVGLQCLNSTHHVVRSVVQAKPPQVPKLADYKPEPGLKRDHTHALRALILNDDACYPNRRSLLPWTDPESINPFYQGMQNMGFGLDVNEMLIKTLHPLLSQGYPKKYTDLYLDNVTNTIDAGFNMYVYPQSGCWENAHVYCTNDMVGMSTQAKVLQGWGKMNLVEDLRWIRMAHFWARVATPVDGQFGRRIAPPIGDHGLSTESMTSRTRPVMSICSGAKTPEAAKMISEIASMVVEDGGATPEGVTPTELDNGSAWYQGYGATMRAKSPTEKRLFMVLPQAANIKHRGKDRFYDLQIRASFDDKTFGEMFSFRLYDFKEVIKGKLDEKSFDGKTVKIAGSFNFDNPAWKGWHRNFTRGRAKKEHEPKKVFEGAVTLEGTVADGKVTGKWEVDFGDTKTNGDIGTSRIESAESYLVLRAGQSWGHHHSDKGALWYWGRDAHFFGDCSWGAPPGGTYHNPYKQGPESGTQIEFKGVSNWPLPCKFPAPWVSDYEMGETVDYANARCLYPYNPKLNLERSSTAALTQGYDRQTLMIKPDILVIRDNVETTMKAIWRLHSLHRDTTEVKDAQATITTGQGPVGELTVLHPAGVKLTGNDTFPQINGKDHSATGQKFRSLEIYFPIDNSEDVTWVFEVHGSADKKAKVEKLDEDGKVSRITLADGTVITALLNAEEFSWSGDGISFKGTVGVITRKPDGTVVKQAIRGAFTDG